jgi:uncharacterized protein (TIGR00369 family)
MSAPKPLAPEIRKRVLESFERQGLMKHLGAELAELDVGRAVVRMPYREELTQQHGFFHAGGTTAICDSAGGYAALTMFPANSSILTVEFKINLLAPALGDYLEAVGKVVRAGRTLTVCQMEVFGVARSERTLVALGQQTLIRLDGASDGPRES